MRIFYFIRSVDFLVKLHLEGAAATMLAAQGIAFEDAYYLIFKRAPRK